MAVLLALAIDLVARRQECKLRRVPGTPALRCNPGKPIIVIGTKAAMKEATMAISADLGAHLEEYVNRLVTAGRYNSKSEVLREGVRLVQEREAKLAALDAALARGLADVEAGRMRPADEVCDRLEAKYKAKSAK